MLHSGDKAIHLWILGSFVSTKSIPFIYTYVYTAYKSEEFFLKRAYAVIKTLAWNIDSTVHPLHTAETTESGEKWKRQQCAMTTKKGPTFLSGVQRDLSVLFKTGINGTWNKDQYGFGEIIA